MRKLLSVLILITVIVLVGCSKYPDSYPLMNVTSAVDYAQLVIV